MKYTEILKLIKETFKESNNLQATKQNGRIIISMKHEKNVGTNEQRDYLDGMENRIIKSIVEQLKEHINESFDKHKNDDHKQ